jgi:outer membrane receptor protein involved in Fe transport
VIRLAAPAVLIVCLAVASPATAARALALDLPPGRLGDAVTALGNQAGLSLAVDDPALWERRVPAIRGRFTATGALKRLLAGSGAEAVAVGADSWRIRPVARKIARPPIRPVATPAEVDDASSTIIVTASKRDVRLRDFSGAVSVLNGGDLTLGGPGGTDAILSRLATVSSTHLGAGRNKLFIRGIADSSFTGPTQATVGQYLGDIRLTYNAPDPDLRLYDIGSVEVLEGPQGTLYGAGSLGGIIRVLPNAPSLDETSGSIEGGASVVRHGAPGGDLAATLNLPIAQDRVGLRIVGYGISDGGYIDNPLRRKTNINRTNTRGGRATLRIAAGDGWTIDIGGILQDMDGDDSQYADRGGHRLSRSSPIAEDFDTAYRLGEFVIGKDWDGLHFRSTTGVASQHLSERFDATTPGSLPQVFTQRNTTNLVTSEARLWRPVGDGLGWVIGGSILHNRTRLDRALGPDDAPAPVTGVSNRVTEFTLYGEASTRLLPWLTATAGGRFASTRLSGDAENAIAPTSSFETLARADVTTSRTTTSFLPSLALLTTPLPRLTLYARYQQGFRPGGLAIDGGFVRRFRNDQVATEEGGFRYGTPGRDRFDFSMSVSHTIWRNIQADFLGSTGLPSTDNIGDGRIWSVSASGGWRPVDGLRLDASVAFNDGRVTKPSLSYTTLASFWAVRSPVTVTLSSDAVTRIPNVARFTARLGFDWQRPIGDRLTLRLNGWGRYVGRSRLGVGPVLGEAQGNYADSALIARVGTARTGVSLGVTNLSDSVGNRFALGTPFVIGRDQITPLRPRTIRLGFDSAF